NSEQYCVLSQYHYLGKSHQ
ncbi:hypothetical protein D030_4777B, partial [Vibrio parahaemolyticus AQ3810]